MTSHYPFSTTLEPARYNDVLSRAAVRPHETGSRTYAPVCSNSESLSTPLAFNTIPSSVASSCLQSFPSTDELRGYRHPIPMQQRSGVREYVNRSLIVGPVRMNHRVEHLWNNQTQRSVM